MTRALGAGVLFAVVAVGALFVMPTLILLVLFVAGPALAALVFSAPQATRERFTSNGLTAALACGLTSAGWIAARGGDAQTTDAERAIGATLSFFILFVVSGLAVFFCARFLATEDELARREAEAREDDEALDSRHTTRR